MSKRYGGRRPPEMPQQRLVAGQHEILERAPLLQAVFQMEAGWDAERGPRPARWYWDGCPNLKRVRTGENLTGLRAGRMTVVGLLDKPSKNGASWVVRCDCGQFETRKAKTIRKPKSELCCSRCDYVWHLRRQAFFDRRGRWPSDGEVAA